MVKGRDFEFSKHQRLDSAERRQSQPPEPLVELVAAAAPDLVADVGVGTGYFALPLADRLPAVRVLGLDIEPRMLDLFRERAVERGVAERIETVHMADPGHLPLDDAAVAAVLMVSLHHELRDRQGFLAGVHRILRPGGRVVVCDWSPEGSSDHGPSPGHRVPSATATAELEGAGFTRVRRHDLYVDHWVLSGERSGS
jgi:ubiquinone/menaquinone biosynthesis C-methylase UbiE